MPTLPEIDLAAIEALLCDADGCLFPSEEPAFVASATVTNDFLEAIGATARFAAEELRLATTGKNFRTTAAALAGAEGKAVDPADLECWVEAERRQVAAHLGKVLTPDRRVGEPLARLAGACTLAVVSSSATARLDVCLRATNLDCLFPADRRFSAESSLSVPTSKPDPAIYAHAGERLGISPRQGLAVEDSVAGAQAAIAAGFPTVGSVMFVAPPERAERVAALERAGVAGVISSWAELERLFDASRPAAAAVMGVEPG
jgi:beta-phosphoglucomutase-like phosphatase (HAD superfamily)